MIYADFESISRAEDNIKQIQMKVIWADFRNMLFGVAAIN